MDEDPTDGYYAVNLAQLLWRAGEPVKGAEVFRYSRKEVRKDRAYYFSWAVAEGRAGNHALDVWLCGVSLDDNIAKAAPDHERLKKSLNGLATAFDKLFERGRKPAFVYACVAAARLGLSLSLDDKTQETLDEVLVKYSQYARSQDISSSLAFHWLTEGIKAAWEQREIDLPDLLREDQLSFQQLAKRFDV